MDSVNARDDRSFRLDANERAIFFPGRTREWTIVARMSGGWLNLYTGVCQLPAESGLRARTLEIALGLNAKMALMKFVAGPDLVLELDYRCEHVDGDALRNLIAFLHADAEENFPKIFRTITGDDVLESLTDGTLEATL